MKNKYINIIASVALAIGATSCVDLDLAPTAQKSTATMWQTPEDAEQGVSMLYGYVQSAMWQNDEDIYTDNAVHGIKWAVGNRAHGVWSASDYSWSFEYSYIRRANLVFANIDKVDGLSESDRNNILGQAYFFRAWIYFDLIKQFGGVPYTTKPLELSEQEGIVREEWATCYKNVMSDFDEAIRLLPETSASGRANKYVALAFKARAALYYANPECQYSAADGWQVAADAAKQIIDSNKYGLFDGDYAGTAADYTGRYSEMFWGFNIDQSKEGILTHYYNKSLGKDTYFIGFECFPKLGWGGVNPTQGYVDCFEDVEGAPISQSAIYDPLKPAENRDPRLATNVIFSGDTVYGVCVDTRPLNSSGVRGLFQTTEQSCGDATLTGYHARKWLNPAIEPSGAGWHHDAASCPMRYTEVLLTYAEAMNELSPLDAEAFEAVNKVRARVGMPALQNTDASKPTYCATQDDLRQRIRNEWRIEFSFEGDHRQWDARRWNIATDVLNAPRYSYKYNLYEDEDADSINDGWVCDLYVGKAIEISDQVISYDAHNYLFPIPQNDIDLNKNLKQNPGYTY